MNEITISRESVSLPCVSAAEQLVSSACFSPARRPAGASCPGAAAPEAQPGARAGGKAHRRGPAAVLPGFRKYIQTLTPNLPMAYVTGGRPGRKRYGRPEPPPPAPPGPRASVTLTSTGSGATARLPRNSISFKGTRRGAAPGNYTPRKHAEKVVWQDG